MNKRLEQVLSAENISQSQLADQLGVAKASISHILAGRNKPGFDFIQRLLLCYPDLSADWFLTGKGRMYRSQRENSSSTVEDIVEETESNLFSNTDLAESKQAISALPDPSKGKTIRKILVFYDDDTFTELP